MREAIVYILDDDPAMRASLLRLCRSDGLQAAAFENAEKMLESIDRDRNSCIVLDLRLETETGLDVQERLANKGCQAPIIFLTGHGTIPLTVKAMRAGASEFLTKPVEGAVLLCAIHDAIERDASQLGARRMRNGLAERVATLTPREREILPLLLEGPMNKQLARLIGTSEITARVHKRRIMDKMGAATLPELVRMADELDIAPARAIGANPGQPVGSP